MSREMASYTVQTIQESRGKKIVFITDDGNPNEPAIREDAQRILDTIHRTHEGARVVYRNAANHHWRELKHSRGKFTNDAAFSGKAPELRDRSGAGPEAEV